MENWDNKQIKQWDSAATDYSCSLLTPHLKTSDMVFANYVDKTDKSRLSKILKHLNLADTLKQKELLDVGCGTGRNSSWFANKYNVSVTGIDISPNMLSLADKQKKELQLDKVNYKLSSFKEFVSTKKYNIILFFGLLSYIIDLKEATDKINSLSTDGTIIIVCDVIANKKEIKKDNIIFHTISAYKDFFNSAGFELIYSGLANSPQVLTFLYSKLPASLQNFVVIKRLFHFSLEIYYVLDTPLFKIEQWSSAFHLRLFSRQKRFMIFKKQGGYS